MNQLLTEMDGVTAQKLVFFIGATNRPDILDPAMMRPGRLDSLIYIGLPDFEARISIFKACLRKSPVDPEVDYEYLADRTEGFSGADIAGVCKNAAKFAIRAAISAERQVWEAKEVKKKECTEKGMEYQSDEDAKQEEIVPYITKKMLLQSLQYARRSVSPEDLAKYMAYKRNMERKLGMEEGDHAPVVGLDAEQRARLTAAADDSIGSTRQFGADAAPSAEDDIYE